MWKISVTLVSIRSEEIFLSPCFIRLGKFFIANVSTSYESFNAQLLGKIVDEFFESELDETFREPLLVDPNEIRDSISHIDSTLFNHFVFENYLNFYEIIEDSANAARYLSDRLFRTNCFC